MKKLIITPSNSEVVNYTAEEIAQDEAKVSANLVKEQEIADAKAQEEADKEASDALKASAKAKLIAGEALTEDEANTIVL
jgi:sugar-specific transcriptional regulator TrmB|tara:strand:+ start:64 stop:303 length:240 start_codon:yes stop_codon:yes gene_type:complete